MSRRAKWRDMDEKEIRKIVSESTSNREVAEKLGYSKNGGGTMFSLQRMYEELKIDISHFKGKGWSKGLWKLNDFEINTYKKNGKTLREPLVKIRGRKCEKCKTTEWLGLPINLEVHHINGDRSDNRLENLALLCPNCHSYFPTFAQQGDKRSKTEEEFVLALKSSSNIRIALKKLDLTPKGANYERAWDLIYKYDIEHLKK
jgi:hypothetical protein